MNDSFCLWSIPPAPLILSVPEVHLWCVSLTQPEPLLAEMITILSEDERERAARFQFPRHQQRFIGARGVLRILLGKYLQREPQTLKFCYGSQGKPALVEGAGGDRLSFNISHSEDIALYAITLREVSTAIGIDIEYLRSITNMERLVKRFFSLSEQREFEQLPENQKTATFFRGWTCKEAFIKAIGDGLSFPLNKFDVCLSPDSPPQLLAIGGDESLTRFWKLAEFKPLENYQGALAIRVHSSIPLEALVITTYQFLPHSHSWGGN